MAAAVADRARTVVHTDGSAGAGWLVGAYCLDTTDFAARGVEGKGAFAAEFHAVALALSTTTGPLDIRSDNLTMVQVLGRPGFHLSARGKRRYPQIRAVHAELWDRECVISHCPGHGPDSPVLMRFTDTLARGAHRRRDQLTRLGLSQLDPTELHLDPALPPSDALAKALADFDKRTRVPYPPRGARPLART